MLNCSSGSVELTSRPSGGPELGATRRLSRRHTPLFVLAVEGFMENMYEALTSKDALRAMTCDQDFDDLESVETRDEASRSSS